MKYTLKKLTEMKIMIKTVFLDGQGLGNQLWVYAAGHAISKHTGRAHVISNLDKFKGKSFLTLEHELDPQPDLEVMEFNERLFYDPEIEYFSSTYDSRVENLPCRAALFGLFQSEKYFYGQEDKLKEWIKVSEHVSSLENQYKDVLVLNIRGGEYKRHKKLLLPKKYWEEAILRMKDLNGNQEILIVTDDKEYANSIFPKYEVLKGGIAECYSALRGAGSIVVSNSSFSYFPIKTREVQPTVIAPEHWARFGSAKEKWAMPSNLYKDWKWMTHTGNLKSYDECIEDAELLASFYEREYSLSVPLSMGIGLPWTRHIPLDLKKPVKFFLSKAFPRKFGR
ncbi:MAG: hypothetical protein ACJA2U_001137 [Marinomonas primoryensis]|jgi:hypothetical protein